MKTFLIYASFIWCFLALAGGAYADTEWRIPGYSSYVEFKNGAVLCGQEYTSYHESSTGKVCAGGQYTSYHQSSTGKVCFGGLYRPRL